MKKVITVIAIVVVAWFATWAVCGFAEGIKESRLHEMTMEEYADYLVNNGEVIDDSMIVYCFSSGDVWYVRHYVVVMDYLAYVIEYDQYGELLTFMNTTLSGEA